MSESSFLQALEEGALNEFEVLANLPEKFVARISRTLTVHAILSLVDRYGGAGGIYVPRYPAGDHPLAQLLSEEDLRALVAEYGGGYLDNIPAHGRLRKLLRAKQIIAMRNRGDSARKVAEMLGVTERYVQAETARCRAGMKPDERGSSYRAGSKGPGEREHHVGTS